MILSKSSLSSAEPESPTNRVFKNSIFKAFCILLAAGIVQFTTGADALAVEPLPYDPIYSESSYMDRPAESPAEQKIYSFVQTTWNYYPDLRWTGPWSYIEAGGSRFFYFGCGICCLTNIYDTLTGESVAPDVMFDWCREYTDYNPSSGKGAISWSQLMAMLKKLGLKAEIHKKPSNFTAFCNDMAECDAMLVLVSSANDKTLWPDTKGHYVTLWNYNENDGGVFVTDPGGWHNRARLSLIQVYRALKTSSTYQYITVHKADE